MKILLCHNHYQQPGGEDRSFAEEHRLLASRGHNVVTYTRHNDAIKQMSSVGVASRTLWNRQSYREIRELIQQHRPDVMHCTNIFPLISPAAYYAAKREGVAVVQSLRNYRLLCPGSYFMRDGKICEDCLNTLVPWPAALHGCYRNSRAGSTVVASMLVMHRLLGTWKNVVNRYFALTQFSRDKFVQGGLPAHKIDIKPNFLFDDPGPGAGTGGYAVFVARLSTEKGVSTLLDAWSRLERPWPLRIIGDGPLADVVRRACETMPTVQWLGQLDSKDVLEQVGHAACVVVPSIWYEGFPRVILEALSRGTPVITARLGSMEELIRDGETGLLVAPGPEALRSAVSNFFAAPEKHAAMRIAAREVFEQRLSAASNYDMLMEIYARAIAASRGLVESAK